MNAGIESTVQFQLNFLFILIKRHELERVESIPTAQNPLRIVEWKSVMA